MWEGVGDWTKTAIYWPPTLMAISVVSFSFSWCSTGGLGAQLSAGFLYHISSLTHLVPNSWLPVFTELYNSSIAHSIAHSIFGMACMIVISGNNCHAVRRSLSSGASVYECIMGFYLVPFRQPNPPTRFLSITGHWNVSLPSSASLWKWHVWPGRRSIYNTEAVVDGFNYNQ